jgi:hypothetical protein
MVDRIQGEATILESIYDPGIAVRNSETDRQRDDGFFGFLEDKIAGVPYEFLLELRVPGMPVGQARVRDRVPEKAEKLSLFDHTRIPTTLVVPVFFDASKAERPQIDWKAFLALPDRVARTKAAIQRHHEARSGASAAPEGLSEQDRATRMMVFNAVKQVRAGVIPRAQFEEMCRNLAAANQLSQADLDEAIALLDAL